MSVGSAEQVVGWVPRACLGVAVQSALVSVNRPHDSCCPPGPMSLVRSILGLILSGSRYANRTSSVPSWDQRATASDHRLSISAQAAAMILLAWSNLIHRVSMVQRRVLPPSSSASGRVQLVWFK